MLYGKYNGRRICAAFLLMSLPFGMFFPSKTVLSEDYFHRSFEWYYKGLRWTWNLSVPLSLYNVYNSVSVSDRTRRGPSGYGFLVTTRDQYVKQVAYKLHDVSVQQGYEAYDEVSFLLAFVQSLPYTSDSVTTKYDEYPRFPIETLVDGGGDCEDTSILFATLVIILNYSAIFISPPEHYAVGVWGKNLQGFYYTFNDRTYYYCETTGDDWRIGDIPSDFEGTSASLYSIDENKQYIHGQFDPLNPGSWLRVEFAAVFAVLIIGLVYILRKRKKEREVEEFVP